MKSRSLLIPTPEHIRDFERYPDAVLQAIRACSHFSGQDRRTADHILFVRSVRSSDAQVSETRWKRENAI
jgi:hypothetical protein